MVHCPSTTLDSSSFQDKTVPRLVGRSPFIQQLRKQIPRIAKTDQTVLLQGETGTGKDLVAQLIHHSGPRRGQPYVPVNCAALPETLLENLLFGHRKGAYTDARESSPGLFQQAEGGTLYLDEIGELPQPFQAKLLRFVETKMVVPLGGVPVAVDGRIIAATNRDLGQMVSEGTFRSDLYYRLRQVPLCLPPLRAVMPASPSGTKGGHPASR